MAKWIKKQDPIVCHLQETHFSFKVTLVCYKRRKWTKTVCTKAFEREQARISVPIQDNIGSK